MVMRMLSFLTTAIAGSWVLYSVASAWLFFCSSFWTAAQTDNGPRHRGCLLSAAYLPLEGSTTTDHARWNWTTRLGGRAGYLGEHVVGQSRSGQLCHGG